MYGYFHFPSYPPSSLCSFLCFSLSLYRFFLFSVLFMRLSASLFLSLLFLFIFFINLSFLSFLWFPFSFYSFSLLLSPCLYSPFSFSPFLFFFGPFLLTSVLFFPSTFPYYSVTNFFFHSHSLCIFFLVSPSHSSLFLLFSHFPVSTYFFPSIFLSSLLHYKLRTIFFLFFILISF